MLERTVADLADRVVQMRESLLNAQPDRVSGWVDGDLQEEPDLKQAGDDRVREFPAALCLLCCGRRPGNL